MPSPRPRLDSIGRAAHGGARVPRAVLCSLVLAWTGCGEPESGPPPPLPTSDGATSAASGQPPTTLTATASDGDTDSGGGVPNHCVVAGEPADTEGADDTTGEDGFKFDVAAPDGGLTFEFGCDDAAERATNLGCEFWAVDLPNDERGTAMSPGAADQQFSVAVGNPSGLTDAHVEVSLPGETVPFASATVPPQEAHTFPLPSASIEPNFGSTDGLAFHVTSDVPIVAYQFNPLDNTTEVYSNDASLLLPTHALGEDYVAVTGAAILLSMSSMDPNPVNAGAFVSVVATQDGTEVELDPTAALVGGFNETLTLNEGEVWTIISNGAEGQTGNLSGTRVRSDAPVAVFSGNVATIEPLEEGACCADHLEHQLSPRSAWSSRYAVAPPPHPGEAGDTPALYRFTGAHNNTQLLYCPTRPDGAPTALTANKTVEFVTDRPFTVAAVDPDHAFGVTQFVLSNGAFEEQGEEPPSGLGDPAMLVLPSALQFEQRFVFVVPAGYVDNRISVVAQGSGEVTLDGEIVPGSAFSDLGILDGQLFRYAQLEVGEGQHTIEGRSRIGVSVFGYDEAVSFAYPGGAGLRVVSIPPAAG